MWFLKERWNSGQIISICLCWKLKSSCLSEFSVCEHRLLIWCESSFHSQRSGGLAGAVSLRTTVPRSREIDASHTVWGGIKVLRVLTKTRSSDPSLGVLLFGFRPNICYSQIQDAAVLQRQLQSGARVCPPHRSRTSSIHLFSFGRPLMLKPGTEPNHYSTESEVNC